MFLKNRNISSKIKRSKVTYYAALRICLSICPSVCLSRKILFYFQSVDLSVGELQMYGTVEWCNVSDSLGKVKKGTELESTVFVFKTGVVFLCRERLKRRKSKVIVSLLYSLPVLVFADDICKQYGRRSGSTKSQSRSMLSLITTQNQFCSSYTRPAPHNHLTSRSLWINKTFSRNVY